MNDTITCSKLSKFTLLFAKLHLDLTLSMLKSIKYGPKLNTYLFSTKNRMTAFLQI